MPGKTRKIHPQPCHANAGPVHAYCAMMDAIRGGPWRTMTVPDGTAAHGMGYRYVAVEAAEVPAYLAGGALPVPV